MIKIYFTKFSENYNPFYNIFEIVFTSLNFLQTTPVDKELVFT